ncbi:hypothetical protein ACQ4LK_24270, partial [Bacillus pumilus]
VEKGSDPAKLAGPNTPSDKKTTEYFVKGTVPTKVSDTYEKKEADKPSDLKAVYDEEKKSITLTLSLIHISRAHETLYMISYA